MSKPTLTVDELKNLRRHLREFKFTEVMNVLGWNRASGTQPPLTVEGQTFHLKPIARIGGVQVIEVTGGADPTSLPLDTLRREVSDEVSKMVRENVLIFVDAARTQSHWYWVKREIGEGNKRKVQPRTHTYVKGQPDDLFVSKLAGLFVDMAELDEDGELSVTDAARLLNSLDSQAVVSRFYDEFQRERVAFTRQIQGIPDERDRAWYASVILNRLMFVYFLQRKGFLNVTGSKSGDLNYLQTKLRESRGRGEGRYYPEFLKALFFEAFAKPDGDRSPESVALTEQIPYLNGGLFLPHPIETKHTTSKSSTVLYHEIADQIFIPDAAFDLMLGLFGRYDWNLSEEDRHAGGLDPDVLGHIFEKYINQKGFGAYYTRPEITEYLCKQTVDRLMLERINARKAPGERPATHLGDALMNADVNLTRHLLTAEDGLKSLSLLDPACGSGAFLVAALKTLLDVYTQLLGRIHAFNDPTLNDWLTKLQGTHASANYNLKKKIITENLYGVDIMEEAAEIAKLRLFLSLVSSANELDDLEPLPNIDFNILTGNSLVGLLHVDEKDYDRLNPQQSMFEVRYPDIIRQRLIDLNSYRHAANLKLGDLRKLRDNIQANRQAAQATLNRLLLAEFHRLGIKYEQATWDAAQGKEGRAVKRALTLADIEALRPFHWGFEFSEVMGRGGFDAIIANPPWDVWEPKVKEFFQDFLNDSTIKINKLRMDDWEVRHKELMQTPEIADQWLSYLSRFNHTSQYFKTAAQFSNNRTSIDGKAVGNKSNLYALFLEQSFRLLGDGGECGIVIPDGIYNTISTKGLREMLFEQTNVTGLFCFENGSSKGVIFENVHRSFKFVVLSFRKGGHTIKFPAAFMRHDVKDLQDFPGSIGYSISRELVTEYSPYSLSVIEIVNDEDFSILQKAGKFPLLNYKPEEGWYFKLSQGFNMTTDRSLFRPYSEQRLVMFEGKHMHAFSNVHSNPDKWIDESEGRRAILGRNQNDNSELYYQRYKFVFRRIARGTDTRTLISTVLPKDSFAAESLNVLTQSNLTGDGLLYLTAVANSFVLDFLLRQRVTANISMYFIYQLPVPRLTPSDPNFQPIVQAAARLICTAPEFDELAQAAGLRGSVDGVTDAAGRAALRAELDGRVAHLYGLTEAEFKHILSTFPLVDLAVKDAALQAFRDLSPPKGDPDTERIALAGEGQRGEFKETFAWDVRAQKQGDYLKHEVFKTVAAFANASGGTLLIGVDDAGRGVGLDADLKLRPKQERSWDKFELYLRQQLRGALTPDVGEWVTVTFPVLNGHHVCRVDVERAPEEIFTGDGKLYVRRGNESRELKGAEIAAHASTLR